MDRRRTGPALPAAIAMIALGAATWISRAADDLGTPGVNEQDIARALEQRDREKDGKKYKRLHQAIMRQLSAGQMDEALAAVEALLAEDPQDPETHFAHGAALAQRHDAVGAVAALRKAADLGLPPSRFVAGARWLLDPVRDSPEFQRLAAERCGPLVHGPMLGCLTGDSARVWVRTAKPARIRVLYGEDDALSKSSPVVESTAETDLTAVVPLTGLRPASAWRYAVEIDGQRVAGSPRPIGFHTPPAAGEPVDFTIAFGGGAGYTPANERMWTTIAAAHPNALLLLGDNIYSDAPKAPHVQRFCYYRRQSRPEFSALIASTPVYAIWDDHDFGTNDCSGGPDIDVPGWKRPVWDVFRQNWNNPRYGDGAELPGCWFDFYVGDVHFIMLDGRYYRATAEHGAMPPTMLGPVQKKWLLETLRGSKGRIKAIVSPVPFALDTKGESPDTWFGFQEERSELFAFLSEHDVTGVVLLSADRHRSDLWRNAREGDYPLYEFVSSRLTNDTFHPPVVGAEFSYFEHPSFGLVRFNTKSESPRVSYAIVNIDGETVFEFDLPDGWFRGSGR